MSDAANRSQPVNEDDVADLLRICFDEKIRERLTYASWKDGIDITRVGSDTMRFVELVIKQFGAPARGMPTDEDIERLKADLRAAITAQGWQDISTAPRDGTRILICREDRFPKNTYVARWLKGVWSVGVIGDEWHAYPTHWQPLPAPPQPSDIVSSSLGPK